MTVGTTREVLDPTRPATALAAVARADEQLPVTALAPEIAVKTLPDFASPVATLVDTSPADAPEEVGDGRPSGKRRAAWPERLRLHGRR